MNKKAGDGGPNLCKSVLSRVKYNLLINIELI